MIVILQHIFNHIVKLLAVVELSSFFLFAT